MYAAEDPLIRRRVAIKILPAELGRDPNLTRRFLAEAQAAGGLNHPNVVTIYDVGEVEGTYYIAMEFVSGGACRITSSRTGSPGWRARRA